MKKHGVVVILKGIPHFCSKFPIKIFFLDNEVEGVHCEGAEVVFREGQGRSSSNKSRRLIRTLQSFSRRRPELCNETDIGV
jgi:hypothetical protein